MPRRGATGSRDERRPLALSSGQAARYCLVTPGTIVNWIRARKLPARRTVGGQYRILIEDLRAFMDERHLPTELLDAAFDVRRYCWEYCDAGGAVPLEGGSCEDCLVRRALARNCFELRSSMSSGADDLEACARCPYLCELRLRDLAEDEEPEGSIEVRNGA